MNDTMRKIFFYVVLLSSALYWNACAPDDPIEEEDDDKEIVIPPWLDDDYDDGKDDDGDDGDGGDDGTGTNPNGPFDDPDDYDVLKNYVNRTVTPAFKLGAAVTANEFIRQSNEYEIVSANFNEVTAGNAMKQASVMRADGSMDFTLVKNFVDRAQKAGMTVYGHTLAWHSQQQKDRKSVV